MTTQMVISNGQAADPLDGKIDLIKKTVAQGASDLELELFLHQCRRTGLDPLARQIYWVKRGSGGTIQTGIDGYRLIAARTGDYAGNDDAAFEHDAAGMPVKATVTVWRFVHGQRCAFTATARMTEYRQDKSQTWQQMPHVMLAKCAEALALRKAFPAELSGLYTDAEMDQADGPAAVESTATVTERAKPLPNARADTALLRRLLAAGEAVGMTPAAIEQVCRESFGRGPRELTVREAEAVIEDLAALATEVEMTPDVADEDAAEQADLGLDAARKPAERAAH
jgi:phage recombination protein Bet